MTRLTHDSNSTQCFSLLISTELTLFSLRFKGDVAIFWARVLCHLVVEDACSRMRVTLGVILIRSLAYTKYVPGRLRRGSRVAVN